MEANVRMINKEGQVRYFTEKTANSAILARAGWVRQEIAEEVTIIDETEPQPADTAPSEKPKRTTSKKSTKTKRK